MIGGCIGKEAEPTPPPPLAKCVVNLIDADSQDPRTESPRGVELIEPAIGLKEGLLGNVLDDVGVAHESADDFHQPAFIALNQMSERFPGPASSLFDEAGVAFEFSVWFTHNWLYEG